MQIDLEMSFIIREDIMGLMEWLVKEILTAAYKGLPDCPFVRMSTRCTASAWTRRARATVTSWRTLTARSKSVSSCRSGLHWQSRTPRSTVTAAGFVLSTQNLALVVASRGKDMVELEKVAKRASKTAGAFVVKVEGVKQWKSSLANKLSAAAIDQLNERLGAEEVTSSSSRSAPISK
ncbi:hypothetical protein PR001_g345 [Phytophthora rubi]|uniref:Uncharacterized protein n=1 Tax=Phytophthora rubi TaxID=129364 RepID=A0A6A3NZM6_9STRA|nr:hypothetical protein PR002_g322 [Phytophthora rubi]KAE9052591.1 hypothetical protein PR001_g345 [Phytophthora rubi]